MKKAIMTLAGLAAVILIVVLGFAQGPPPPPASRVPEPGAAGPVTLQAPLPPPPPGPRRALHFSVFMGAMMDWGKTVTGAPYSAGTITETTQTLSDGNRIDRKETGTVYRDSAGRTRRERTLSMIGPWATSGRPAAVVTIHDPVAHVAYVLNSVRKTAYKLTSPPPLPQGSRPRHRMRRGRRESFGPASTQSLGTRTIEGVKAEGTRNTVVIPAGKIGNEKPITIVSESWYSPELQVYVLTKRDDPRFGETTYRLTNIKVGAPPASLFQVPSDYAIRNMPLRRRFEQRPATRGQGSADPR